MDRARLLDFDHFLSFLGQACYRTGLKRSDLNNIELDPDANVQEEGELTIVFLVARHMGQAGSFRKPMQHSFSQERMKMENSVE